MLEDWFVFASPLHIECFSLLYKGLILGPSILHSLWVFMFIFLNNFLLFQIKSLALPGSANALRAKADSVLIFSPFTFSLSLLAWQNKNKNKNFLFCQELNDVNILNIWSFIFIPFRGMFEWRTLPITPMKFSVLVLYMSFLGVLFSLWISSFYSF